MKNSIQKCLFIGVVCFFVSGLSAQESDSKHKDILSDKMEQLFKASNVPGASLAVVLPDGEIIAVAIGKSSIEDGTPMKISDRMMSASIGKTYFSAIAVELLLKKSLSLDD